jgi:predicted AAA+ superfamily ATPase
MSKLISRNAITKIYSFLDNAQIKEVLVVTGARQVGKTTAIEQALLKYPEAIRINLEENGFARERIDTSESFEDFEYFLKNKFNFNPAHDKQILFIV